MRKLDVVCVYFYAAPLFLITLLCLLLSASAAAPGPAPPYDCTVPSPSLELFYQPLSFSPFIDVSLGEQITLGAYRISQQLHPHLPNTELYGFGTSRETASFPGPTLMARRHVAAYVRWENHIEDEEHLLPISMVIKWAIPSRGGIPIVVHLHGGETPSMYDGHPEAWMTWKNETGPTFVTQDYVYPNEQPAAGLWYHDHTYGITRLNVQAGLEGMYIVRPGVEEEAEMGLPDGAPLVLKDMRFFDNGSMMMPGPDSHAPTDWCPEWYDVWLVNGKVWPYVNVFAKPYRFRILNSCNARFLGLYLNDSGVPFLQIGTDGGLLPSPMEVQPYLLLSPGERADVIIDFSGLSPKTEIMLRTAMIYPEDDQTFAEYVEPLIKIMLKFIVVEEDGLQVGLIDSDSNSNSNSRARGGYLEKLTAHMMRQHMKTSSFDQHLAKLRHQQMMLGDWNDDVSVREVAMTRHESEEGSTDQYTIGDNLEWDDPPDIFPQVGTYEVWEVINAWTTTHNFHMHLVQFMVINEQKLNVRSYLSKNCSMRIPYPQPGTCLTNRPQSPSFSNRGWKDTFSLFSKQVIRILVRFAPRESEAFSFDATLGPGYVLHCHVVQHEDHSAMRPFILVKSANESRALAKLSTAM